MAEETISQSAPVVETPQAPVVTETPVASVENSPVPVEAPVAAQESTVLGAEPVEVKTDVESPAPEVKAEDKPVEAPKPVEGEKKDGEKTDAEKPAEAKTEEKKPEEKTELPVYESLVLPEGVALDPARLTEIDSMFGNMEKISGAKHEEVQKFRQAFVEYGLGVIKDAQNALHEAYIAAWKEKRTQWRKEFESDPEYGTNRKDTTVAAANQFIRTHGGTADQQKELRSLLEETGLGNHKAIIRSFANANLARAEGKPLAAVSPPAPKMNRINKMYGKKK